MNSLEHSKIINKIMEAIPDLIFILDENKKFIEYYTEREDLLITKPEDFLGKYYKETLPEEFAKKYEIAFKEVIAKGKMVKFEHSIEYPDKKRYFEVRLNKYDKNKFIGVIKEVTRVKSVENQLKSKINLIELLTYCNSKIISSEESDFDNTINEILEKVGEYTQVNRVYIFEFNDDNTLMDNTYEWCSDNTTPQIQNLVNLPVSLFPKWMDYLNQGKNIVFNSLDDMDDSWSNEKSVLEPQDVKSIIVLPILSNNGLRGFIGFDAVDKYIKWTDDEVKILRNLADNICAYFERVEYVKELNRKQLNFSILFDTIKDCVFVMDTEGIILKINKTVSDRLNYSENELIGKSILEVHPPHLSDVAANKINEILKGNEYSCNLPLISKEGIIIPVETKVEIGVWNGRTALIGISKDLTEIKKSEEKFFKSFSSNPSLMAITDLKTNKYTEVNKAFLTVLGYTESEVKGKSEEDLIFYKDASLKNKADMELQEKGYYRNYEMDIIDKNGIPHTGIVSGDIIDVAGEKLLLTVINDITEKKQIIRALRQSEEQLSSIINTTMVGILTVDSKLNISHVNDAFKNIFQIVNENINGKNLSDVFPLLADIFIESDNQIVNKRYETNLVHHNIEVPVFITINHYFLQDEIMHVIVVQDLTKLKQTQQQLINSEKLAILGKMISGLAHEINSPLGAVKSSSELAYSIIESYKDSREKIPENIKDGNYTLMMDLIFKSALNKDKKSTREIRKSRRKTKKMLAGELEESKLEQYKNVIDDFTELITEAGLENNIYDYLTLLDEEKSEDVINLIKELSYTIQSLIIIKLGVERANSVVSALKNYSHFAQTSNIKPARIYEGIETVLKLLKNKMKRINIITNFNFKKEVLCNPDELMQVWTNLISNSIDAVDEGGSIFISIEQQREYIVTSVKDDGCGIPGEHLENIFQPFFTTKEAGAGSGLGLDIVKLIIDKHNGKITVKSEINKGTEFKVYIPYR